MAFLVPVVPAQESSRIEEITVRARKRDEFLVDTPVSVTAIDERKLEEAGVTRLDDIQGLAPNLQFSMGRSNQDTLVQIRGIGTPTGEIAFDPGVGVYVDGVFLPRSLGGLVDVLDVQQVEVLRGPQGTLFGKNTVGGALSIRTIRPRDELEASVLVRAGNFGRVDTRAMLNIPLGRGFLEDKLMGRFAFASSHDDGYVRNVVRGERWSDRNSLSFLGSLRLLPSDDVSIDVSGAWSRSHARPLGGRCVVDREAIISLPTDDGNIELPVETVYPGLYEDCRRTRPHAIRSNTHSFFDIESYGTWGTMRWAPNDVPGFDDVEIKSITGWREQRPRLRNDIDSTALTALDLAANGGGPLDGNPIFQRQISEELQLNGAALADRLNFVAGAFAFWEEGEADFTTSSSSALFDFANQGLTQTDNWNWALYGQATADLFDWLSITAGVRYTQEKKGIAVFNRNLIPNDDVSLPRTREREIFSAWTPMASVALKAPDDHLERMGLDHLMAYFTYARGFRGGGFNGVINPFGSDLQSFDQETLDSFEVGVKTVGLERRLNINLALFHGYYRDIQVNVTRVVASPDDPRDTMIQRITENAAKATIRGVELESLLLPWRKLQVEGSLGLLDSEYDSFSAAASDKTGDAIDRAGESFPFTPKVQTRLALRYPFDVDGDLPERLRGVLTPRIEWTYRGEIHYTGKEVPAGTQSGVNLLNARLGYSFNDGRTQIAAWGRNLSDETYFSYAFSASALFGTAVQYYAAPLTWGGEIRHRF